MMWIEYASDFLLPMLTWSKIFLLLCVTNVLLMAWLMFPGHQQLHYWFQDCLSWVRISSTWDLSQPWYDRECPFIAINIILQQIELVINSLWPSDVIDLGQHQLMWWLVAWRQQVITWTKVNFSLMRFYGIHLRVISPCVPEFENYSLKVTVTSLNELTPCGLVMSYGDRDLGQPWLR